MVGNSQNYQPEKHAVVKSDRGDGRLLSTYAIVHEMLKGYTSQYHSFPYVRTGFYAMAGWSACCNGGDHEVSRDKGTTVSLSV